MTTCNTCGQPLPEPVYVGPGDKVTTTGYPYRYLVLWGNDDGLWIVPADAAMRVSPQTVMTKDSQPVAGFRDPRDARIAELELQVMQDVSKSFVFPKSLTDRIAELEAQLATTREALADERLNAGTWQEAYTTLLENRREGEAEANPLAGLSDEQLKSVKKMFMDWAGYNCHTHFENACMRLLRDLRDGKLEVPR